MERLQHGAVEYSVGQTFGLDYLLEGPTHHPAKSCEVCFAGFPALLRFLAKSYLIDTKGPLFQKFLAAPDEIT